MAWSFVEENKPEETGLQSGIRNLARSGARAAETLLDIPRNVVNLPQDVISLLRPQESAELAKVNPRIGEEYSPREAITKPLTGNYLEPKTEGEQTSDEWVTDFTRAFIQPNKLVGAASVPVARLAKWASKEIGIPEEYGEGIKNGVLLLGSVFGARPVINKTMNNLYGDVEKLGKSIGKPVPTSGLTTQTLKLKNRLGKRSFSGEELVNKQINKLNKLIPEGNFEDLWQFAKDNNKLKFAQKDSVAREFLGELTQNVKDKLVDYGKINKLPQLGEALRSADELFSATKIAGPLEKTLRKIPGIDKIVTNPLLRSLILPSAGFGAAKSLSIPNIAGLGATAALGYEFDRLFSFLANSPKAQQLLAQYGKQALRGNAEGVSKTLRLLNSEMDKKQAGGTWSFVD